MDTTAPGISNTSRKKPRTATPGRDDVRAAEHRSSRIPGERLFPRPGEQVLCLVSIVVPGSALVAQRDKDRASLDVLGMVRDKETKFPIGNIRDNIKLTVEQTQSVTASGGAPRGGPGAALTRAAKRKNVQYNTGFLLPPGRYHLKFVVRENQNGRVGNLRDRPDHSRSTQRENEDQFRHTFQPESSACEEVAGESPGEWREEIIPNIPRLYARTVDDAVLRGL